MLHKLLKLIVMNKYITVERHLKPTEMMKWIVFGILTGSARWLIIADTQYICDENCPSQLFRTFVTSLATG